MFCTLVMRTLFTHKGTYFCVLSPVVCARRVADKHGVKAHYSNKCYYSQPFHNKTKLPEKYHPCQQALFFRRIPAPAWHRGEYFNPIPVIPHCEDEKNELALVDIQGGRLDF